MTTRRESRIRSFDEAADIVSHLARRARERITIDAGNMDGAPCIRGMPITVAEIVRLLSQGYSNETVLKMWPDLTQEDIDMALRFAADQLDLRYLFKAPR